MEERPSTVVGHYREIGLGDRALDNIHIHNGPLMAPDGPTRLAAVEKVIEELRPALVIADTLAHLLCPEDGNDYSGMTAAMRPYVDMARRHQCHFQFLHHNRKAPGEFGSEVLGSTGFAAMVDTVMSVSRDGDARRFYAIGRDGVNVEEPVIKRAGGSASGAHWPRPGS